MLYSFLAGLALYYVLTFVIGLVVAFQAIESSFIAFTVIAFLIAYLARNYSRTLNRLSMRLGIITLSVLLLTSFLLMIPKKAILLVAVILGLVIYTITRRRIYRYYNRPNPEEPEGTRVAPPLGREWCRWLCIIMM